MDTPSSNPQTESELAQTDQGLPGSPEMQAVEAKDAEAKNAYVQDSMALSVSAKQDAHVENSMVLGVAAGRDLTAEDSFCSMVAVGRDLNLKESGSLFITVGNQTQATASTIGVLLASDVKLDGGSKVLMTSQQALAFGAAFGVVFALLSLLLRRPKRRGEA